MKSLIGLKVYIKDYCLREEINEYVIKGDVRNHSTVISEFSLVKMKALKNLHPI